MKKYVIIAAAGLAGAAATAYFCLRKRKKRVSCVFEHIEDIFERKVSPTQTKRSSSLKGTSTSKRQRNGHIRFRDEGGVARDKNDSALVQHSSNSATSSYVKTINATGSKLVENDLNQLVPATYDCYSSVDKIKSTNVQRNKKPKNVVNARQFPKTKPSGNLEAFQDPKVTLDPTPFKDLMPGYKFYKFAVKRSHSKAFRPLRGMKVKKIFIIAKSSAHSATSQELNSTLKSTLNPGSKCIKNAATTQESILIGDCVRAQEPETIKKSTLLNESGLIGDSILSQKSKVTEVSIMAHDSAHINGPTQTKLSKFQKVSSTSKSECRTNEIEKVTPLRKINNDLDNAEKLQKGNSGSSDYDNNSAIDFVEDTELEYQSDNDSDDSYISVADSFDVQWKKPKNMKMYNEAMKLVTRGEVTCRKIRNEMRFVESEEDFLAKVHCLRQGFKVMFEDKQVFTWVAKTFQSIVVEILQLNELEPAQDAIFIPTYAEIINFVLSDKNKSSVVKDLKLIGIFHPTFYDVFLCYFLMDTFHDVEHPKSTLTHFGKHAQYLEQFQKFRPRRVAREIRKEFSDRMKGLSDDNKFLIMMYRLNFYINPGIAMGLRGPKSLLKKAWTTFKKEAMDYIECLFNFDYVRYTKPGQMADDLLSLTKERLKRLKNETKRLEEAKRFIEHNKYSRE